MSDLIYVALVVAFFAVATLLVRACEHIIGPDETVASSPGAPTTSSTDPIDAAGVR